MTQESVLRPIVNSLLWARKNQDTDAVQDMIQQCKQYLEQMECTDIDLYNICVQVRCLLSRYCRKRSSKMHRFQ